MRGFSEIFRHRQSDKRHAQSRAGGLVHLPEYESGFVEHSGLRHFLPEIIALTRPFTDTGKYGISVVFKGDVADELHDEHRFPDTCAAEQTDLAAFCVRRHQVDHLDSGLQHLIRGHNVLERRGYVVDRPALLRTRRRGRWEIR